MDAGELLNPFHCVLCREKTGRILWFEDINQVPVCYSCFPDAAVRLDGLGMRPVSHFSGSEGMFGEYLKSFTGPCVLVRVCRNKKMVEDVSRGSYLIQLPTPLLAANLPVSERLVVNVDRLHIRSDGGTSIDLGGLEAGTATAVAMVLKLMRVVTVTCARGFGKSGKSDEEEWPPREKCKIAYLYSRPALGGLVMPAVWRTCLPSMVKVSSVVDLILVY